MGSTRQFSIGFKPEPEGILGARDRHTPGRCLTRRLIWVELRLGRVPCVLSWIQVLLALHSAINGGEADNSQFDDALIEMDRVLGALLLRTEFFDLKDLEYLPKVLVQLQLDASFMALLFALGHEGVLRSEGAIPSAESPDAVLEFFNEWANLEAFKELASVPEYVDRQTLHLASNVLGCNVDASVPNDDKSLFLAEAVLAVLESFLSTCLDSLFVPHTPRLHLKFVPRSFMDEPVSFVVHSEQPILVEIFHSKDRTDDDSALLHDKLIELVSTITAHISTFRDEGVDALHKLIRDERGFGRAMLISNVAKLIGNVLGDRPKIRISDWKNGID